MNKPSLVFLILMILVLLTGTLVNGQEENPEALVARARTEETPRIFLPLVRLDHDKFDMADFIVGDGRLYEVWHSNDSQARHQTQLEERRFYHTKGIPLAEWEELWIDDQFVYRGTDTSPGGGLYYTLREGGQYGSKWSPRYWNLGDVFERNPMVTFYTKSNCTVDAEFPQKTWLRFADYFPRLELDSGIIVGEVILLDWLLALDGQPAERYYYARDYGLVAWENNQGDFSYVSEVHPVGARPDNVREVIDCLDTGDRPLPDQPIYPARPYKPPYRAK